MLTVVATREIFLRVGEQRKELAWRVKYPITAVGASGGM
jgi:hypothetical protein